MSKSLVGEKFGKLTVIKDSGSRTSNRLIKYFCECDCGNTTLVSSNSLKKGKTQSCGCKKGERENLLGNRYGRLLVTGKSNKRRYNQRIMWICKCDCGNEVAVVGNSLKSGATQSCGCLANEKSSKNIMRADVRDKLKEHRDNVIVEGTNIDNLTQKLSVRNKSGVKGVSYDKSRRKWVAQIRFKGVNNNLGRFSNKQDAINARKEAEEKYFKPILEKYKERN